jgi:regulator of sirC expression with transglutaminase-like and TPR domain
MSAGHGETARERFRALAQISRRELPLAEGALLIAAEEYPELDIPHHLRLLDDLAASARAAVPVEGDPALRAAGLCRSLAEQGFRGNTEAYDDPRNSFLNEVLERRVGIPISLAAVYLEVGWRLHLPLYGVGMPVHFLVGYETNDSPLFVDAFHGTVLTEQGCGLLLARLTGGSMPFRQDFLAPTPARDILVRMLRNLKTVYASRGDLPRTAAAVERILLLAPDLAEEIRDLGLVRYRQGNLLDAKRLLERYLLSVPKDAVDRAAVAAHLRQVRELLVRLN